MAGLIFLVIGVGEKHRRQLVEAEIDRAEAVECQHAIGLGVGDGLAILGRFQLRMVGLGVAQGKGKLAVTQIDVEESKRGTQDIAPFVLCRTEVALQVQFAPGPGGLRRPRHIH